MNIKPVYTAFALLMVTAALFLVSCSGDEGRTDAPSSKEIIKTYTDTLATAPDRAREATEAAKERNTAQEDALKGF